MNLPSLIILLMIAALAVLAVRYIARNGSSCSENCNGSCGSCSTQNDKTRKKLHGRKAKEYYAAVDQYFTQRKEGGKIG
jgi:hypothetical protein